MLSGFWIAWLGDYFTQEQLENRKYDSFRGGVVASYGGLEILFEAYLFLPILDMAFGKSMTRSAAFKKVFCEQMIYTPSETACFIKWTNYLEHQPESYEDKMSRDYLLTLWSNWLYWGPMSFVNYYLVPIRFRALFIAGTTLVIDVMMSFATHNNLSQTYEHLSGINLGKFFTIPLPHKEN
jgi:hypothetical protein